MAGASLKSDLQFTYFLLFTCSMYICHIQKANQIYKVMSFLTLPELYFFKVIMPSCNKQSN